MLAYIPYMDPMAMDIPTMVHVLPFFGSQDIGIGPCHDAPCARSAAGAHAWGANQICWSLLFKENIQLWTH